MYHSILAVLMKHTVRELHFLSRLDSRENELEPVHLMQEESTAYTVYTCQDACETQLIFQFFWQRPLCFIFGLLFAAAPVDVADLESREHRKADESAPEARWWFQQRDT